MFIQTEDTPNPASMKFIIGREVVREPLDIADEEEASISPLAQNLFQISGVKSVFLGTDFITVTKDERVSWQALRPLAMAVIMDHFVTEQPVLYEQAFVQTHEAQTDDEVVRQIKELLDLRIRPALAQDGGDVAFDRYEDGVVYLRLKGACAGCPSAAATLKFGIEQMMHHFIPEVVEVRRVL
ncbi:MAG: NifU family protein [Alphaproteobacteria bacterium]|nr:NifU family protein [Alphaproteobacteria bacterium]